jgi:predicted deacylase
VHPGELPSSHVLNGVLKFLISNDPIANILLSKCVFYIVPFVNPDGVDRGLYRSDSQGQNLNRHYTKPTLNQPEILGIKKFVCGMIADSRITFCLDLHAHAAKKGCFIYGNYIADFCKQIDICLFPKLLSINNPHFDYDGCNFSEKNMYSVDRGDTQSK